MKAEYADSPSQDRHTPLLSSVRAKSKPSPSSPSKTSDFAMREKDDEFPFSDSN